MKQGRFGRLWNDAQISPKLAIIVIAGATLIELLIRIGVLP